MDPGSPAACAGRTVGWFSMVKKGEFQVANDPALSIYSCLALISATYSGVVKNVASNSVVIKVL